MKKKATVEIFLKNGGSKIYELETHFNKTTCGEIMKFIIEVDEQLYITSGFCVTIDGEIVSLYKPRYKNSCICLNKGDGFTLKQELTTIDFR